MGLRGTLEEGEPRSRPGTYLNGVFEERPLPHAEGGYGYPESGQTVVNVTDGKLIRLIIEDSPFDVRYGDVTAHERVLDFRTGLLTRRTEWTSPNGRSIRVESQRLVSFTHRTTATIVYEVTPLDPASHGFPCVSNFRAQVLDRVEEISQGLGRHSPATIDPISKGSQLCRVHNAFCHFERLLPSQRPTFRRFISHFGCLGKPTKGY